jgi:hypothetical protein
MSLPEIEVHATAAVHARGIAECTIRQWNGCRIIPTTWILRSSRVKKLEPLISKA